MNLIRERKGLVGRAFSGFIALDKLPASLIASLRGAKGAKSSFLERHLINISDSPDALQLYKGFLTDEKSGGDPLVSASFLLGGGGEALSSFVPYPAQDEVWGLLMTYSKLVASDFVDGAPLAPFVGAKHPLPHLAVHFHHAKIALQAVQDEIESLAHYADACPALAAVSSGTVICDLGIQYGNCNIAKRLRRK